LYNPEYNERELGDNQIGVRRALHRKLNHELGIPLEQTKLEDYQYMTRIMYVAPYDEQYGEHEIDYCFMYQYHTPGAITVDINKSEIEDTKYVTKQQLIDMMNDKNLLFTPWFKHIANNFLFKWWDAMLNGTLNDHKDIHSIHNMIV
jgi:isopentenyl-diphosphate delta-isomerase